MSEGHHEVVRDRPRRRLAHLLAVEEQPDEDLGLGGGLAPAQLQVVLHGGGLGKVSRLSVVYHVENGESI